MFTYARSYCLFVPVIGCFRILIVKHRSPKKCMNAIKNTSTKIYTGFSLQKTFFWPLVWQLLYEGEFFKLHLKERLNLRWKGIWLKENCMAKCFWMNDDDKNTLYFVWQYCKSFCTLHQPILEYLSVSPI